MCPFVLNRLCYTIRFTVQITVECYVTFALPWNTSANFFYSWVHFPNASLHSYERPMIVSLSFWKHPLYRYHSGCNDAFRKHSPVISYVITNSHSLSKLITIVLVIWFWCTQDTNSNWHRADYKLFFTHHLKESLCLTEVIMAKMINDKLRQ